MVVIGFRRYARTLAVITVICDRCGNPAAHRVSRRTRRFMLLFLPLFPVARTYGMFCSYCGEVTALSLERVDELLAGAAPRPALRIADAQRPRP